WGRRCSPPPPAWRTSRFFSAGTRGPPTSQASAGSTEAPPRAGAGFAPSGAPRGAIAALRRAGSTATAAAVRRSSSSCPRVWRSAHQSSAGCVGGRTSCRRGARCSGSRPTTSGLTVRSIAPWPTPGWQPRRSRGDSCLWSSPVPMAFPTCSIPAMRWCWTPTAGSTGRSGSSSPERAPPANSPRCSWPPITAGGWQRACGGVAADGVHYEPLLGDPLDLGPERCSLGDRELLGRSRRTAFPDAPRQLVQLFSSARTGDVVLAAARGSDFREAWEIPEHRAGHGSLIADHMEVALAASVPLPDAPIRTVDLMPTMLETLGLPIPAGLDGIPFSRLAQSGVAA